MNVRTGPVWFRTEDLRHLDLLAPVATPRRIVIPPSPGCNALLTPFKVRLRREGDWVCGDDLAEWYVKQRGSATADEAEGLRLNARREVFRALLRGEFTECETRPHVRPHFVNEAGVLRLSPERVKDLCDLYSCGYRGDGEPFPADQHLPEIVKDVWLPACLVRRWCEDRNIKPPSWLAPAGASAEPPVSPPPARRRSGAAGRPSSMDLVRAELERRTAAGMTYPTSDAAAQNLAEWLRREHPAEPQLKAKSIINSLRAELRRIVMVS
jgi:hypothetical protein